MKDFACVVLNGFETEGEDVGENCSVDKQSKFAKFIKIVILKVSGKFIDETLTTMRKTKGHC